MKKNPKVSVIIPVYNVEKYLSECLNSILKQKFSNYEIIIIDDGSTDNSGNICDEFAKKNENIKVIHKKNEGVSSARNDGIKISTGEWVTFVDADDTVQENYIKYLYNNAIENDAEISLTYYPNKMNNNNKNKFNDNANDKIQIFSGKDAAKMMLYYKIVISSWNKMFKRDFLIKNEIYFNNRLSYGEGFDFVINAMIKSNKTVIGNKKIYNYRVDNLDSVMTVFKVKLITGSIDSQECIYNRINSYFINEQKIQNELEKACTYSKWHTYCDCLNTIYGSKSKKSNYKLTKQIEKECKKGYKFIKDYNVPKKDKIKAIMYFLSPKYASYIINNLRIRKFNKNKEESHGV